MNKLCKLLLHFYVWVDVPDIYSIESKFCSSYNKHVRIMNKLLKKNQYFSW